MAIGHPLSDVKINRCHSTFGDLQRVPFRCASNCPALDVKAHTHLHQYFLPHQAVHVCICGPIVKGEAGMMHASTVTAQPSHSCESDPK